MPHKNSETIANADVQDVSDAPKYIAVHAPKRGASDAALRALKPKDKIYRYPIGGSLYLEVTPKGAKHWRWKYRIDGKENRYALGSYPDVSLKDAKEAVEAARKLVKQGLHPAQQKRIKRQQSIHEQANTFETLAKEWMTLKDWEEVTKKRRLDMLKRVVFPTIGELPVREISPQIILDILKKAAKNNGVSVMAEAKRTMYGIFELAAETFRVDTNPVHQWRAALPKNKTQHKEALSKAEIGQLLRDIDTHGGNYQTICAFKLMWYTLARPSEVVEAEWTEFDLDAAIWRIPAKRMKKRKEHVVPLPTQAVKLLLGMHTITGDKKHLFPHRDDRAKPMVAASFRQMLKKLGWAGRYSPHATRATGSTHLNEMGVENKVTGRREKAFAPDWIECQLAHADPNGVRSSYNHTAYFHDRERMMQQWADLLDQWKRGESNVVPIKNEATA